MSDSIPRIRANSVDEFITSKEGKECYFFLSEYCLLNAEIRRKRFVGLSINYSNLKTAKVPKEYEDLKIIVKRHFVLEMISLTLMTTEDLAAFCLAFEEDLEDLPSKIIGYSNTDIKEFYKKDLSNKEYLKGLFLFPDSELITKNKELREKIDIIQNHNIEALRFYLEEIKKYRKLFARLYAKGKHGYPLLMRMKGSAISGNIDPEDLDVVFVMESKNKPFEKLGTYIVGKKTIQNSYLLLRKITDILITLIIRRFDYLKYLGNYPPLFVFGENPLTKNDWLDYKKKLQEILPQPKKISKYTVKFNTDVSEQYEWLHSKDWTSKWFKQKEWEYEEGSKIIKNY